MSEPKRPIPLLARLVAVLITLVVSGTGLLAVLSEHAPERSTRFGMTAALEGEAAVSLGMLMLVIGLLPLGMVMPTARAALWFMSAVVAVFLGLLVRMLV